MTTDKQNLVFTPWDIYLAEQKALGMTGDVKHRGAPIPGPIMETWKQITEANICVAEFTSHDQSTTAFIVPVEKQGTETRGKLFVIHPKVIEKFAKNSVTFKRFIARFAPSICPDVPLEANDAANAAVKAAAVRTIKTPKVVPVLDKLLLLTDDLDSTTFDEDDLGVLCGLATNPNTPITIEVDQTRLVEIFNAQLMSKNDKDRIPENILLDMRLQPEKAK
jgi:hypothetical protein